jgi:hypothetical protein
MANHHEMEPWRQEVLTRNPHSYVAYWGSHPRDRFEFNVFRAFFNNVPKCDVTREMLDSAFAAAAKYMFAFYCPVEHDTRVAAFDGEKGELIQAEAFYTTVCKPLAFRRTMPDGEVVSFTARSFYEEYGHPARVVASLRPERVFLDDRGPPCVNIMSTYACDGVAPSGDVSEDASDVLEFFREVWCDGHDGLYAFLINWLACLVQRVKPRTALVLDGPASCGKTAPARFLAQHLLGKDVSMMVADPEILVERSAGIHNKALIVLDGASGPGVWDERVENTLHDLTTSDTLTIKRSWDAPLVTENTVSLIVITNTPTSNHRYATMPVSGKYVGCVSFWRRMVRQFNQKTANALAAWLKTQSAVPEMLPPRIHLAPQIKRCTFIG